MSISRQQKYQIKHHNAGLCSLCPDNAETGSWYCLKHMIYNRERQREVNHCKGRYNSKSYRLSL